MSNPHPLDAAARDELARKAEAARKADSDGEVELWVSGEMAEFWAECTPDVILALCAALEAGEADTRDAERYRFLRDRLGHNLRARDGLMELHLGYEDRPIVFKTGIAGGYTDTLVDAAIDNARAAARSPLTETTNG